MVCVRQGGVFVISSFLRASSCASNTHIRRGCPKGEERERKKEKAPDEPVGIFVDLTIQKVWRMFSMTTDVSIDQGECKGVAVSSCTSGEGWKCRHSCVKPPASFDFPVKQDAQVNKSPETSDTSPLNCKE